MITQTDSHDLLYVKVSRGQGAKRENCHNIKYDKNCYTNLSNWKRSLDYCLPIYVSIGRYIPSISSLLSQEEIKFNVLELAMSPALTVSEISNSPFW